MVACSQPPTMVHVRWPPHPGSSWYFALIVLLCGIFVDTQLAEERANLTVSVPSLGTLRGSTNSSFWTRRPIYQFKSIPYAESPSGPLRFQPPVPAKKWSGVFDATNFRRKCPQASTEEELINLQTRVQAGEDVEDCLHLNVYTAQVPGNCSMLHPVMFYIHGGSFRLGSPQNHEPNYLLERDVVLVTTQYRLGLLDEIAGNMGLLDMVLALKWVQAHITDFCGDPKQVTVFGQSAGGAAVSLLTVSPLVTEDLFNKIIIQSGSALCNWAVDYNPRETAYEIAAFLNCDNSTIDQLESCYKSTSPDKLLIAHSEYLAKYAQIIRLGGVDERKNGGSNAVVQTAGSQIFLHQHPDISYRKGEFLKIPMIAGMTKHEGTFLVGNMYDFVLDKRNNSRNRTEVVSGDFVKMALLFSGVADKTGVIKDIFERTFFQVDELGNFTSMIPGLVDLCGDTLLKVCTVQAARYNRQHEAPTYLYSFNYKGHLTKFGWDEEVNYPFPGGVSHSDDNIYLYPFEKGELTFDEKNMAQTMVELWTNFAIYGNPTPAHGVKKWPSMENNYGPYLRIDAQPQIKYDVYDEYKVTQNEGLSNKLSVWPSDISASTSNQLCSIILIPLILFYCTKFL